MALEMKSACERCERSLTDADECYICVFECTWCPDCTDSFGSVCPNCGGELVRRPRPPS